MDYKKKTSYYKNRDRSYKNYFLKSIFNKINF